MESQLSTATNTSGGLGGEDFVTDAEEWFLRTCIFFVIGFCVLVPVLLCLNPSPRSYISFVKATWNVRVGNNPNGHRWLPLYFLPVFASFFRSQAIITILHYPLLVDVLGATVLEVGYIDAASALVAAALDIMLRTGPLRNFPRSALFLLHSIIAFSSYSVIVAIIVPRLVVNFTSYGQTLALILVVLGQTLNGLDIPFQEYGVMRNDAKDDIVNCESVPEEWRTPLRVSVKLGQLHVVLRYPATLLASGVLSLAALVFHRSPTNHRYIYVSYFGLGILGTAVGLVMAVVWRRESATRQESPKDRYMRSQLFEDLRPGGRYFGIFMEIGTFNAISLMVRNGYPRMINLRALTMGNVENSDINILIALVFGVSALFFWLSDIGQAGRSSARGRRNVGMVSFALLGIGHATLGLATGFKGLLSSCLVFGFGQAVSTGLRTVWKDEVRGLLRLDGQGEAYRKNVMKVLAGMGTLTNIVNSLLVGVIGDRFGLDKASFMYASLAVIGFLWTFRLNEGLQAKLLKESERMKIDMATLLANDDIDIDYWHSDECMVVK